jgi:hypothetical protein
MRSFCVFSRGNFGSTSTSRSQGDFHPRLGILVRRPKFLSLDETVLLTAVLSFLSCSVFSQTTAPASDPQAVALAAQAVSAVLGKQAVQDLTLTGSFTWGTGSSDEGTVTLKALGSGESRIDFAFANGTRTEIRDASTGVPLGKWIAQDGKSGTFASQNTMTDAAWFFPALGSLADGSKIVLSYVGLEARNGQSVQHLRSYIYQSSTSPEPTLSIQQLSTMDFYLDASTSLPVAVVFNQHPDNNARVNIPIEVDYSDYRSVSGINVPMHLQKLMNGAPLLDVTLRTVAFNSGLNLSEFSVN